ncbi:hypothetical protein [Embleya sp. NPDC005575]|uniref:hypothetical protein n=1 Tax=Embleya sp. NPDC005575 TaxID=3156892 RepID=UPI0033B2454D
MNPSRVLAAGLVSAAALVASAPAALATATATATGTGTGTTVVVTGDDYYVAADDVVVRRNPTEQSAVVEIAHHGDGTGVRRGRQPNAGPVDPRGRDDSGRRRTIHPNACAYAGGAVNRTCGPAAPAGGVA